ncbi:MULTISPECIES: hypothetical protein [unclassified Bradyrhizobium]|uniref:hypothetical protein n=1 Tax=unclassified Bradyrhizobium TaxID=2631580 RepID=UPI00247AD3B3|nr:MULTISPECIES: hypothetical protein [unclassified Bradyrhizobium]WGS23379.1 hypothetical protein MTX22_18190 [Bradyrhizobium sp. ISRA463]WGS30392.1 hypothetical protein MTX19_15915 [Bradyrhizobium sp. ISRA464]
MLSVRRKLIALAVAIALSPLAAIAQQFNTLPPNSVIGRIGNGVSGPASAIPFSLLSTQLGALNEAQGYQRVLGLVSDAVQTPTSITIASGQHALVTGISLGATCVRGSTVVIPGAGLATPGTGVTDYAPLVANVSSVSGTTYVLDTNASTTIAGTVGTVTCGTDNTAAVNNALTLQANSYFPVGTYLIAGNVTVPSSRNLMIPDRTHVFSAGRFTTAEAGAHDVHYVIDGDLHSLGMQVAATPTGLGWPVDTNGNTPVRGFLEFGAKYTGATGSDQGANFSVSGTGSICGEFSGTPNFNNPVFQLNRKGILALYASNVLINVREVCGFHGEAVIAVPGPGNVQSIRLTGMYVHDVRFDALDFNAPFTLSPAITMGGNEGLLIDHNYIENSYIGIESPIGTVTANRINNYVYTGIQWGLGSGLGPMIVTGNTVVGGGTASGASLAVCGSASRSSVGTCLGFSQSPYIPGTNFVVANNIVINPGDSCYVFVNASYGQFSNNQCNGAGQATSAAAFDFTNVHYVFGSGNSDINAGAHWTASIVSNTSDNLALGPVTTASKGSLVAMGNDNISTYISPSATAGLPLINNVGAAPSYGQVGVAGGGTGAATLPAHSVLLGNGTGPIGNVLGSTAGQPLVAQGSSVNPAFATLGIVGGGTNCAAASGTCLDNITGFATNGMMVRTGAGTYTFTNPTGAVKNNGSGTLSQAACADLSNAAASCSTDTTNAANISSGTLPSGRVSGAYTGITNIGTIPSLSVSNTISTSWQTDASSQSQISLAQNATANIATGSGLLIVYDASNGNWALVFVGGGNTTILNQNAAEFAVTSSPSTSQTGIVYNGSTNYIIKNGFAASHGYNVYGMRINSAN